MQVSNLFFEVKLDIQSHLVVARSTRVELLAHASELGSKQSFDVHMDIFGSGVKLDLASGDLFAQLF